MRTYEITERPAHLGGGWNVKFYENGEPAGGAVCPVPEEEPQVGITWWNSLQEPDRAHWMKMAGSAVPADAWQVYRTDQAYVDAVDEGESWSSPPLSYPHP